MAAKLSRSWSFFRRPQSNDYLGQDYQPGTPPPSSKVNLQQRFGGEEKARCWRQGPLPPPPTQICESEASYTPAEGHHSLYTHPDIHTHANPTPHPLPHTSSDQPTPRSQNDPTAAPSRTSTTLPRRPLRSVPSGVAPLFSNLQDNWTQLKPSTRRVFSEGGRKVNRALQGVRTSFSSLTQMFRSSTRRRYKLDGSTPTRTPKGRTPVGRRTPGKLYSPFNMSTPATPHSYRGPKRLQHHTPRRNSYGNENRGMVRTPQHHRPAPPPPPSHPHPSLGHPAPHPWLHFDSPSRRLSQDVGNVRRSMREFQQVTSSILHHPNQSNTWTQFR